MIVSFQPLPGPGASIYAKKNHSHPASGVVLETVTAPPATAAASTLGTATTAAHANHTHQTGAHAHVETDVTSLTTDLAGKAASTHTHTESDVTSLVADLAALPKGRVASSGTQNSVTGTFTTTETAYAAIANLPLTTVNGRRYRVSFVLYVISTVASDVVTVRLRDGGASAPTSASTLLYEANWNCGPASTAQPVDVAYEWLPGATTAHHLGLFAVRAAGTGSVSVGSITAGRLSDLLIEDIGT